MSQEFAAAVISELAKGAVQIGEGGGGEGGEGGGEGGEGGGLAAIAEERQAAIVNAGGITPLVSVDQRQRDAERRRAPHHLSSTSNATRIRSSRRAASPRSASCSTTHPRAHEHAVAVLTRLALDNGDAQTMIAKKLVSLLSLESEPAKRRCAHLLYELGTSNDGAPVRIVNAGAISPLVAILGTTFTEAKEAAIGALSCLAQNESSNQLAIAMGLVKLLDIEKPEVEDNVQRIMAKFAARRPSATA